MLIRSAYLDWCCNRSLGVAGVPPGAVEHEDGMGSGSHRAADLLEMELHGFTIGIGHHRGSTDGALGVDGTEQVGPFVAGVARSARPRADADPWASREKLDSARPV